MIQARDEATEHQRLVNRYFQSSAPFWKAIYERDDVHAAIHQERSRLVLSMVSGLGIPRDARVLEVGCGAGLTSVALAGQYLVEAVDIVQEMLDLTRERARAAGLQHRVRTRCTDANHLTYPEHTFDLVLAIGVLPWLHDHSRALHEFARVLRPGGHLIVNIDNAWALHRILDPQLNPVIRPLKRIVRTLCWRVGILDPQPREQLSSSTKFDRLLSDLGLAKVDSRTLGFGPFSLFSKTILPGPIAGKIHRWLQNLADRGFPVCRSTGAQYLVVTRKTGDGTAQSRR